MSKINRDSLVDAQKIFEKLLPDVDIRLMVLNLLADAILLANHLERVRQKSECWKSDRWSLNLDQSGRLIRFNTGSGYCINIDNKPEILVICDRNILKKSHHLLNNKVEYQGYDGKNTVRNVILDNVPDCLVKAKGSIGCLLKFNNIKEYLPHLQSSNIAYIENAMMGVHSYSMKKAHSRGVIAYLSSVLGKEIPNPIYGDKFHEWFESKQATKTFSLAKSAHSIADMKHKLQSLEGDNESEAIDHFAKREHEFIAKEQKELSQEDLDLYLKKLSDSEPLRTSRIVTVIKRNPYVVIARLRLAKGICGNCGKKGPFINDATGIPYLEVHHKKHLANNGLDSLENTIALCPNCHKHAHYGASSYGV